jgi:hypothetical protein
MIEKWRSPRRDTLRSRGRHWPRLLSVFLAATPRRMSVPDGFGCDTGRQTPGRRSRRLHFCPPWPKSDQRRCSPSVEVRLLTLTSLPKPWLSTVTLWRGLGQRGRLRWEGRGGRSGLLAFFGRHRPEFQMRLASADLLIVSGALGGTGEQPQRRQARFLNRRPGRAG